MRANYYYLGLSIPIHLRKSENIELTDIRKNLKYLRRRRNVEQIYSADRTRCIALICSISSKMF